MFKSLSILSLIFLSLSCGRVTESINPIYLKDGHSKVIVTGGNSSSMMITDVMVGGIMIYAYEEPLGEKIYSFRVPAESALAAGAPGVDIPNGRYFIFAVGYTGPNLSGIMRCGVANDGMPVDLIGAPVTLPMTMSEAQCSPSAGPLREAFTDAPFYDGSKIAPLKIHSCGVGGLPGSFQASCGPPGTAEWGMVELIHVRKDPGLPPIEGDFLQTIKSGCFSIPNDGSAVNTGVTVPLGTTMAGFPAPFYVQVRVFRGPSANTCDPGTVLPTDQDIFQFSRGIVNPPEPPKTPANLRLFPSTSPVKAHLYLEG